jgi:hypothetical protein
MLGAHVWIALAEALITAALYRALATRERSLASCGAPPAAPRRAAARPWIAALAIAAVVAASQFLSSRAPDGLESAAIRLGLPVAGPAAEPPASFTLFLASAGGALVCGSLVLALLAPARSKGR